MKQTCKLAATVLLCALLLGCGRQANTQAAPDRLSPTKQTENDNLRCYPLNAANCRFLAYENDLLALFPGDGNATLCRYAGKQLVLSGEAEVPEDAVLCAGEYIDCYDSEGQALLRFSDDLSEVTRYSLPGCTGAPMALGQMVYYCTSDALMELDTETLLHRTVRSQSGLTLTALLEGEALAVCAVEGENSVSCVQLADGSLRTYAPEILGTAEYGSRVQLCLRLGYTHCLYLGRTELLLSLGWEFLAFLPKRNEVLVYWEDGTAALYDLTTGNRTALLTLPRESKPEQVSVTGDGNIFFGYGDTLYRWEPERETQRDSQISITPLYTPQEPDETGLAQCRQRAAYLENQYGLEVLLNTNAVQVTPKGWEVEAEHLTGRVTAALSGAEAVLGKFPSSLLRTALDGRGNTYLCIVRSIRTEGEEVSALQFWSGQDCYILVAASQETEKAVLEAIAPLIDRRVLMTCDAYDSVWLTETPAEAAAERRELLYQAMQEGNRELFLDAVRQKKLRALCAGLRQAFSLQEDENLLWEQYLW